MTPNLDPPIHLKPEVYADVIWALTRALWKEWESPTGWIRPEVDTSGVQVDGPAWIEAAVRLLSEQEERDREWAVQVVSLSVDAALAGKLPIATMFSARRLAESLTESAIRAPELEYHLLRSFRIQYRIVPFGEQISKLYRLLAPYVEGRPKDVPLPLNEAESMTAEDAGLLRDFLAYFEVLQPERKPGWATTDSKFFDLQSAPTRLFGLYTSIPGFDSMFGGSGLTLFDSIGVAADGTAQSPAPEPPAGRIVLVNGPFGAGKSLLTLQFAVEVARKGGIVIVASMEQSLDECLFALRSIGIDTQEDRFEVRPDIWDSYDVLRGPVHGKGALVFLRLPKSYDLGVTPLEGFVAAVRKRFELMGGYSLRLLVIDPIDAAIGGDPENEFESRKMVHRLFEEAKAKQINLWLTSEKNEGHPDSEPFAENVADTVLQLGIDRTYERFFRRTVEVKKSRLQREEPGRHSLMITSGQGIHIYLASSARTWWTRRGRASCGVKPVDLGITGIEQMLPHDAVRNGDLIVFHGPPNSARTSAGLKFLQRRDGPHDQALLIADMDHAKAQSVLEESAGSQSVSHIRVCSIVPGWIEAGQILERISDAFEAARRSQQSVSRILLTNLSQWEFSMPLIGNDAAFGRSLLNLLRNCGATCIITTSPEPSSGSLTLTDLAMKEADCQLEFDVWDIGNKMHSVTRVLRSHEGKHRRDRFEIIVDEDGVRIEPGVAALHRKDPSGAIRSVTVRSSLHADTLIQRQYDSRLMGAIGTSLTGKTEIEEQITHYDPAIFSFHRASAVDELQIIQLDEFQLPRPDSKQAQGFHKLRFSPDALGRHPLSDRLKRFADRVVVRDSGGRPTGCIALPYYENISLLAYRNVVAEECLGARIPGSDDRGGWDQLRRMCLDWQTRHPEPGVFFSAPIAHPQSIETYNCLFFEILLCRRPVPDADCGLSEWLSPQPTKEAAHIFRDLCHRSYRHSYREALLMEQEKVKGHHALTGSEDETTRRSKSGSRALGPIVWRHWYNTLNAYLAKQRPEDRNRMTVQPLFGNITTAGEWYLALPAYSAAPEIGWDLISMLTSYERELQRVYLGVGLPTRKAFYALPDEPANLLETPRAGVTTLSPFFDLDLPILQKMVQHAFQRSNFPCYPRFTETISSHLKRILELPEPAGTARREELYKQVDRVIDNLIANLAFIRTDSLCESCRGRGRATTREG